MSATLVWYLNVLVNHNDMLLFLKGVQAYYSLGCTKSRHLELNFSCIFHNHQTFLYLLCFHVGLFMQFSEMFKWVFLCLLYGLLILVLFVNLLGIVMICRWKKLQSWLDVPFIMRHFEMELVVVLLVVSSLSQHIFCVCVCVCERERERFESQLYVLLLSVYYVGPNGWKKLSGDDVAELHYNYYPVEQTVVEQVMAKT